MKRHTRSDQYDKLVLFIVAAAVEHLQRLELRHQTEVGIDAILQPRTALQKELTVEAFAGTTHILISQAAEEIGVDRDRRIELYVVLPIQRQLPE